MCLTLDALRAFVPSGVWPLEFEGAYLFADYTCGSIFKLARSSGQVRRIAAVTGTNRTPTASATATPRSGPVPLTVAFNASVSSDPDGDTLRFDWDFGDGTPHATTAIATHTYSIAGRFTAADRVTDPDAASAVAASRSMSGTRRPRWRYPRLRPPRLSRSGRLSG